MLDTAAPSLARAWDHLLGGGASFAADRALAQRLEALHPGLRDRLSASRRYVSDRVAGIARTGVDQYLDLGAGLPTRPAVHETARAVLPGARVAYVDRDPAVIEHGRALVPASVRYLQGDLAEPEAILSHADLAGFLDISRPVCLILALTLHVLDPGTARAVAGVLIRAAAPDSFNSYGDTTMAAMHATFGTWPSYVTVNLMTMDYGSPSPGVCVVAGGGCDMGQSALQAAYNLHDHWGVPWGNIELTPMIGGNDVASEQFTLQDTDEVAAFAVAHGLAGVHYWSYDRDVDCPPGYASPTCNSLGGVGPHGFLHRFLAAW